MSPLSKRLGYTVSSRIYLPAKEAMGTTVSLTRGRARIYAGSLNTPSHRVLATLEAGQSHRITNLFVGEVVSVQGNAPFSYTIAPPVKPVPPLVRPRPCTDPMSCEVVTSVTSYWLCNVPTCFGSPWVGEALVWPGWAAHERNDRSGVHSRTVYSATGEVLHPYMGAWADGCQVSAVTGTVLIIEWQRGADVWRETLIEPGETHVIDLVGSEDSALIESNDFAPSFSVRLKNCNPQPLAAALPALTIAPPPLQTCAVSDTQSAMAPDGMDECISAGDRSDVRER
jgi:hypothetical protein